MKVLARRLIEPYVATALEKGNPGEKMNAIGDLVDIDRERVLEILSGGKILAAGAADFVRWQLALSMVKKDPVEATAMVESMSVPRLRANAFVELRAGGSR